MKKRDSTAGVPAYDADYHPEHAKKFCLLGATNADLGRMFGMAEKTFEKWMGRHPDLKAAVHEGRELADADIASALHKRGKGYRRKALKIFQFKGTPIVVPYHEEVPADVAAATFWLTNRRPDKWKHRRSDELGGPDGGPLVVERIERVIIDPA